MRVDATAQATAPRRSEHQRDGTERRDGYGEHDKERADSVRVRNAGNERGRLVVRGSIERSRKTERCFGGSEARRADVERELVAGAAGGRVGQPPGALELVGDRAVDVREGR